MDVILWLLLAFFVFVVPLLAIIALVRVRDLERRQQELKTDPKVLQRLYALEQKVAALEGLAGTPAAPAERVRPAPEPSVPRAAEPLAPVVSPGPAAPTPPTTPRPAAPAPGATPLPPPPAPPRGTLEGVLGTEMQKPSSAGEDLESLIGGRLLNRIGIAALLLGAAFFLKFAYDNRWIGPAGQVAILLVCGAALLAWSQWLLRRGYPYFSEGIAGLGGAVLYLALYFGWSYHKLFTPGVAFAGMIPVTATLVAIAVGRNSQRIAVIALLGGFATPMLASTGRDQQVALFSYLAVLDASLVALGWLRRWRSLELLAFAATQIYFWGWYAEFYVPEKLLRTTAFATLFFLIFAAIPFVRANREQRFTGGQVLLVLSNAFLFLIALRQMMWPEHRWTLTLAVLALSALHLAVSRMSPPGEAGQPSPVRILYAGLALTFATLAIPIRLEGKWITLAWAIEGALLVWSGFRLRLRMLRAAGLILFAIVVFRLFAFSIPAETFLLNARFLTWLVSAACLAAGVYVARQNLAQQGPRERSIFAAVAVAANLLLLWTLSQEVLDAVGRMRAPLGMAPRPAQQMMLTLLWTLYATALISAGFVRKIAGLRWQGYPLLALVYLRLLALPIPAETFLFNPRMGTFLVAITGLAIAFLLAQQEETLPDAEQPLYTVLPPLTNFLLFWVLSQEVWDLFGRMEQTLGVEVRLAQHMGLSLLWALYATALILLGVKRDSPLLRWQALALFGLTVAKVFTYDLSFLSRGYRILSFLVLGVVLLAASFLYTRRLRQRKEAGSL